MKTCREHNAMSADRVISTHTTLQSSVDFKDAKIQCIDCNLSFVWSMGEQVFFRDKHLENPPKRCRECKLAKNERLKAIDRAKRRGKRPRIEVKAQCARCLEFTTVPFYPSQGRPVYCRACFLEMRVPRSNSAVSNI